MFAVSINVDLDTLKKDGKDKATKEKVAVKAKDSERSQPAEAEKKTP